MYLFIWKSADGRLKIAHVLTRELKRIGHIVPHRQTIQSLVSLLKRFVLLRFREDEDASNCAVPISTSLIKQIVNKNGGDNLGDNLEHILADFYGQRPSAGPPWPYTDDADR